MPPNHESFEALFNIVSSFAEKCRILDEEHPTELNFFNEITISFIELHKKQRALFVSVLLEKAEERLS